MKAVQTWEELEALQHLPLLAEVHHQVTHVVAGFSLQGEAEGRSHCHAADKETHTHTLTYSHTYTHTLIHTHTYTHTHTHTLTHIHTHTLTHTHTYTHTHTLTHTHTYTHTLSRSVYKPSLWLCVKRSMGGAALSSYFHVTSPFTSCHMPTDPEELLLPRHHSRTSVLCLG